MPSISNANSKGIHQPFLMKFCIRMIFFPLKKVTDHKENLEQCTIYNLRSLIKDKIKT